MENSTKYSKVRGCNGRHKRCRPNSEHKIKIGSATVTSNDFLKHRFLPLLEVGKKLPPKESTEKDFFDSLEFLKSIYGFQTIDTDKFPYPYNILMAYEDAFTKVQRAEGQLDVDLMITVSEYGKIRLTADIGYCTGYRLYYIPVAPVYRLIRSRKNKKAAELLLSVFSYLYHIAGIPYYREEESELFRWYEFQVDWLADGWDDEEEVVQNYQEIDAAFYIGDVMLRRIYSYYHVDNFAERIDRFTPHSQFDRECLLLAERACQMMQNYPKRKLFDHFTTFEEDDEDYIITGQQYVSFISDNTGLLFNNMSQSINDELGNCSEKEEPRYIIHFDTNEIERVDLQFEALMFPFLEDLCTLLTEMNNENNN
ncbi:hypothetical protein MUB18_20835 [Sphingobacterium sp. PCS056]|uniref:hypothetical protein n=1 Tax=Sphingobacterium sp. PCS056 TaxID=2931400 RepID=UPI00200C91B5|nr:hypothetical protein [Sphingobacterium sp. PCS056]UPZ36536.1 hypothetical protein MUB18_20835 [Sphingobacterium sp. PCS056]